MNRPDKITSLPRLLYLGDVPVESFYHGSTLLYRLLQTYPIDRLQIVEAGLQASLPQRRLKAVAYRFNPLPLTRLQTTRLNRWYATGNLLHASRRAKNLNDIVAQFNPQALVTVAQGVSWITAAEVARTHGLPLHLICHDEWVDTFPSLPIVKKWKERVFRKIYQNAASRLCVSPFMEESFAQRYDAGGTVLYPSRAVDAVEALAPPERLHQSGRPLIFAYAGSVYSSGALRFLAECLQPLGGKLLIYAPLSGEQRVPPDLDRPNIQFQGSFTSSELIARLRQEADVLFVPMSFDEAHRPNMETCFPSKLTDYTAVGLPLLIHGPEYGSAVRWARENPGVAEVVTSAEPRPLIQAVERLASNPEHLQNLAQRAIEVGELFFSHRRAWRVFQDSLLAPQEDIRLDAKSKRVANQ